MIYYFLFFIIVTFSLMEKIKIKNAKIAFGNMIIILNQEKYKNFLYYIIIGLIIFIGGLRYEVGTDWHSYQTLFLGKSDDVERSYRFVSNFFDKTEKGYSLFIFLYFWLAFMLKIKFISKFSKHKILSLLLYITILFLVYDLNGIRQGLALGITLYSTRYIVEKKKFFYIIFIVLATAIHISAIIFLPAYYISRVNFNKRKMIIVMIIVMIIAVSGIIPQIIKILYFKIPIRLFQRLYDYAVVSNQSNNILGLSQRFLIFSLLCIFENKMKRKDEKLKIWFNFYSFSFFWYLLFYNFGLIATRGIEYYRVYDIIIIPLILDIFKDRKIKIIINILIIIYCFLIYYKYVSPENSGFLPYQNILFK